MGRIRRYASPKRVIKRLLRPVVRRIDSRTLQQTLEQTTPRLDELHSLVTALRDDVSAIQQYLPAVLNSISSQNAASRAHERALAEQAKQMVSVAARAEFIRKEVLYEARYQLGGSASAGSPAGAVSEPKLVTDRAREASGDIRLNLGAGHILLPDYLNVDVRPHDGIDIVADIRHLPFGEGQVAEIFSAHLLEHFPIEELERVILPYWVSRLRPGGLFVAVVPDAEQMIGEYVAGRMTFEEMREVTFGDQEYDGDFHFNMFSRESLVHLLRKAGLSDVEYRDVGRRNGVCYEMEIEAVKPDVSS